MARVSEILGDVRMYNAYKTLQRKKLYGLNRCAALL